MRIWKLLLFLVGIETLALTLILSSIPKVRIKPTDRFFCDMTGIADSDKRPVEIKFFLGRNYKEILVIEANVNSWSKAQEMCSSWNYIGYEYQFKERK